MKLNVSSIRFARLFAALASPATAFCATADAPAPAGTEPKTHTLFMGADVSVEKAKKTYPLRHVTGGSWIVGSEGKTQVVKANGKDVQLKLQNKLKLSAVAASLTKLKTDRVFSPGRDPELARLRDTAALSSYYADVQSAAVAQVVERSRQQTAAAVNFQNTGNPGAQQDLQTASIELQKANQNLAAAPTQSFVNQQFSRPIDGREDFDAVRITFELSSPVALREPYVVVTARFQEPSSKPGPARIWLYARALDAVNETPRRVQIDEPGFPPGFTIENVQVNLYDGGTEIPTDVSPKRVALTANEAFQYMVLDYVGSNKGATLPAAPFLGNLPLDWKARMARGQLKDTYYVRVSREGLPLGAFVDEACAQAATEPELVALLKDMRFKPALKNGRPVDAVLPLKLSRLSM